MYQQNSVEYIFELRTSIYEYQCTHCRPYKSHVFALRFTVLTSISQCHGYWSLSHGKSKVYLVQKTVSFLRSSSDSLDSNAKIIDGLCEDPIAAQIRKLAW